MTTTQPTNESGTMQVLKIKRRENVVVRYGYDVASDLFFVDEFHERSGIGFNTRYFGNRPEALNQYERV